MVINMINNKFNIEEMPDLTTNPKYNTLIYHRKN